MTTRCSGDDCGRELVAQRAWDKASPAQRRGWLNEGKRMLQGHGLCRGCYLKAWKAGAFAKRDGTVRKVSVFDLTDADLELAAEARQADSPVEPLSRAQQLERRAHDLMLNPPARKRRLPKQTTIRSCSRCGIDTIKPDLCVDCEDVLALEAS